ncbi:MAG: RNA polymerase sigma factor [Gemmatimonadota bacterium]
MKDENDDALIRRVLAGDSSAYAALVERYRPRLGRYAVRMLGNQADAEDALQETFIRAYRSLARCEPKRFHNWLFGILINRCRTYASRRARRERVVSSDEWTVESSATQPVTNDTEWRAAIEHALEQLPAEQREAFLLKHVEELSYEEMQEITGARVPALKMRVLRAREALRRQLQEKVVD